MKTTPRNDASHTLLHGPSSLLVLERPLQAAYVARGQSPLRAVIIAFALLFATGISQAADTYTLTISYAVTADDFPGIEAQTLPGKFRIQGEITTETIAVHLEKQVGRPFAMAQLKVIAKELRKLPMDVQTALRLQANDTAILKGVPWQIENGVVSATVMYLEYPVGVRLERVEVVELKGALN